MYIYIITGIQSSGKASYFLAIFPYVIMFILLIRSVTLPGSLNGIKYFLTPQWDQLLNPKVSTSIYIIIVFIIKIIKYMFINILIKKLYSLYLYICI